MSKGNDQGPAAGAFESPTKTGWLYKHGGSGMSSHWRKRWFVADHHYLFYYKGPNDKKPVGIVCLPEYESCHKAEGKAWKKQNTFMLDRGNSSQEPDSQDGAKNYVLYADSEEEMLDWIQALSEEIKPMIGENPYANGFGGGGGGGGKSESTKGGKNKHKKSKGEVSVDDKALDDVTAMAGEGPKLTHLTTSRPKVPRGRRPPKRYAVFHEDDSNPEAHESPSESPDPTKTSEAPPSPSPGESPQTQRKKGHKPTAPLLPSASRTMSVKATPKTPPTPPAKVVKQDTPDQNSAVESESPTATPLAPPTATPIAPPKPKLAKPLPPKKPAKEKPDVPVAEPAQPPSPSTLHRPTPPVKPVKEVKEEKTETTALQEGVIKPSPVKKPRPQPPAKRRTSSGPNPPTETTAAPVQIADSAPQPVRPTPAPRPVPRKRVMSPQHTRDSTHVVKEEVVAKKEEAKPVAVEEPVAPAEDVKAPTTPTPTTPTPTTPTPATPTAAAPEVDVKPPAKEEQAIEPDKPVQRVEETTTSEDNALPMDTQPIEEPAIPDKPVSPEAVVVKEEDSQTPEDVSEDVAAAMGEKAVPEREEEKREEITEVKLICGSEDDKEAEREEVKKMEAVDVERDKENVDEDTYEDMEMGEKDSDETREGVNAKCDEEYEIMTFNDEEEGGERKTGRDIATKTATTAEKPQQRVAPGKVNQYDEVAGDFLPYNPPDTETAAAPKGEGPGVVSPGRINQYDEVAGDFLPLNYTKPKATSPTSTSSAHDGGASGGVAPRIAPGYEIMQPAAPAAVAVTTKQPSMSDGDYVPMKDGVMIGDGGAEGVADEKTSSGQHEYMPLGEWIDNKDTKDLSPSPRPDDVSKTDHGTPPSKSLVGSGSHDNAGLAPEMNGRQSVVSSSGSTASDVVFQFTPGGPTERKSRTGSGAESTVAVGAGAEGERRRGSSSASKKSGDGSGPSSTQLHRDSLGYTKIKEVSVERVNSVSSDYDRMPPEVQVPPEIIPMAAGAIEEPRLSIPETLQQAKEILRLAKVVKAEAAQMREEARKELTLAKKDRHDAMLMKKNAAEILRMAKERLGSSTK